MNAQPSRLALTGLCIKVVCYLPRPSGMAWAKRRTMPTDNHYTLCKCAWKMGHIWITKHNCHRAHSVLVRELSFQGGVVLWQVSKAVCCSGSLFACWCSTNSTCWETIDAASNGSKDGSRHCNRKARYRVLVGGRLVEGPRVVEAQKRSLAAPSCNNRFSWHRTNP